MHRLNRFSRHWLSGLLTLLCLLALSPAAEAQTAVAGALRVEARGDAVVVRLALSQPLASVPTGFLLDEPARAVVDLAGASSMRRDASGSGAVKSARVSQFDPDTVRIVLDLARPMRVTSARQGRDRALELRLEPVTADAYAARRREGRKPVPGFVQTGDTPSPAAVDSAERLDEITRVLAEAEAQAAAGTPPPPAAEPRFPPPPTVKPPPPSPPRQPQRLVVVLDPGHGGKDPGAPSVTGGHEKEVVLAVALQARRAIEREAKKRGLRLEVRLTRADDRFVTLGGRVRLARDWGADLFLSIHADAAANADATGATVYTLSDVASDREAARVAAKENRADLLAGIDLSGENQEVAGILFDLGRRDAMNASADFAQLLQQRMAKEGVPFRQHYHRFAGFQVLRNLGVPAILLETGYLSNQQDARRLFSDKGRRELAEGIADAVIVWATR